MIDREVVFACYRTILGRDPENEAVITEKQAAPSIVHLLTDFLQSPEFITRDSRDLPPQVMATYVTPARQIDVDIPEPELSAMFARIQSEWTKLGEDEPYWSVLTHDTYKSQNLDSRQLENFFETGKHSDAYLDIFSRRTGARLPTGACLEFGCGTGRVTRHLAARFDKVIAVDISPGNLALCEQNMQAAGVANVSCILLQSPEDMHKLPAFDFLFSTIVLQHNPPPVQKHLLDILASRINDGGGLFVQIPTHTPGYSFDAKAYMKTKAQGLEMHCLPMHTVFAILDRHDLVPLEVLADTWTGLYGSHTFFAMKRQPV